MNGEIEDLFRSKGIRPTAVRLLVWRAIVQFSYAFSLSDLEEKLQTVDKSSIFRVLTLFAECRLLHEVDDGSGFRKYCVCDCPDKEHHCGHVHISCTHCHKTFCLTDVPIPSVPVPEGFYVEETEYIVKGVCRNCREKGL